MSTHTPGPWTVYKNRVYAGTNHLRGQDVAHVRTNLFDDEQEQERMIAANARLIAAAPDLLASLQALSAYFGDDTDNGLDELLTEARAAIAQATGGAA